MAKHKPTYAQIVHERDQAIVERDEAIAERDYALKFFADIGTVFNKSSGLAFEATAEGVEVRALYPSQADAEAVATHIHDLRAMAFLAGDQAAQALH